MKKIFVNRDRKKEKQNDTIYQQLDALTFDLLHSVQELTSQLQAEQSTGNV